MYDMCLSLRLEIFKIKQLVWGVCPYFWTFCLFKTFWNYFTLTNFCHCLLYFLSTCLWQYFFLHLWVFFFFKIHFQSNGIGLQEGILLKDSSVVTQLCLWHLGTVLRSDHCFRRLLGKRPTPLEKSSVALFWISWVFMVFALSIAGYRI